MVALLHTMRRCRPTGPRAITPCVCCLGTPTPNSRSICPSCCGSVSGKLRGETRRTKEAGMIDSPTRIAVIGAGHVGATFAYALLLSGLAAEIVLIDANRERAEGE